MNNVALDPSAGKPQAGDVVWSALPDAPVVEPRPKRRTLRDWLGERTGAQALAGAEPTAATAHVSAAGAVTPVARLS